MKIEGFSNTPINIESPKEGKNLSVSGSTLADAVSFERNNSSDTEFMGKSGLINGTDGSLEDIKNKAQTLKNNLNAIFNKMDTGTAAKLDKEGLDINNTDIEKVVTVVDQIQIKLAMFCDDFKPTVDIDSEDIKAAIGGGEAAYEIAKRLQSKGIVPTKENVSDSLSALETTEKINPLDDATKGYILKNNVTPTINNIYIASHSSYGSNSSEQLSEKEWNEISPQVALLIKDAGLELNDYTLNQGKWLVENKIDVTTDNINMLFSISNIDFSEENIINRITANIIEGNRPGDTILTDNVLPWEETKKALDTLDGAYPEAVYELALSDKYTLEQLSEIENNSIIKDNDIDTSDYRYIKAERELQEIRLMMTIDAGRTLEKNGISINTTDISNLVEELRKNEMNYFNASLSDGENSVGLIEVIQANQSVMTLADLMAVPSAVIGSVLNADETTAVNSFVYHVPDITDKLAKAGEAYEALSTEIRSDLGDSVSKAIKASTSDILSNMGYEDNDANRRAVRILAYNNMDITTENIDRVKSIDSSINELFNNMTPQAALSMIKDGINPLETPVEELNAYLIDKKTDSKKSEEKYSEFLYKLDKAGKIDTKDREKYIGIYSLVTKFQKDGLNAIGGLQNQGLEVNMGNLLTAYMSSKSNGIELSADDNTGLGSIKDKVTYYKNLFGSISHKITPDAIDKIEGNLEDMSVDDFVQAVSNADASDDSYMYERYVQTLEDTINLENEIYKYIADNEIPATFNNLFSVQTLIQNPGSFFNKWDEKNNKNESQQKLFDILDSKKELNEEYEQLMEQSRSIVNEAIGNENSSVDMDALRQLGNTMNLVGTMAKKNNFFLPYNNDGNTGVINLRINETGENKGLFEIKISNGIRVSGALEDNNINADISGEIPDEIKENMQKELESKEYICKLNYNESFRHKDFSTASSQTDTSRIFKAAQIIINELTKIN